MGMKIRPADGLVTRLLQQQTRPLGTAPQASGAMGITPDQCNSSALAHPQNTSSTSNQEQPNSYGYKQDTLESKLLGLYAHRTASDSKE